MCCAAITIAQHRSTDAIERGRVENASTATGESRDGSRGKGRSLPWGHGDTPGGCDGGNANRPSADRKTKELKGKVTQTTRVEVFDLRSCVEGGAARLRRHHHGLARVRSLRLGHQKLFSRHEEPDGAADALRPNGPIVKAACAPTTGLSSVDAVRNALRPEPAPTFEAAFGGAWLDPLPPPHAAGSISSLEDRLRGSKAQPFGSSDLGDRSRSKARPFTKNPGFRDGTPRFLGRETLEKPDSATSIAGPRTRMECLKRPTAKSVHFGLTNLPQKFCRRPNPKTLVHLAKAKVRGSASLRRPLVWYHSRNPREDFTNESARYRQD